MISGSLSRMHKYICRYYNTKIIIFNNFYKKVNNYFFLLTLSILHDIIKPSKGKTMEDVYHKIDVSYFPIRWHMHRNLILYTQEEEK